jgi:hypothetical protein
MVSFSCSVIAPRGCSQLIPQIELGPRSRTLQASSHAITLDTRCIPTYTIIYSSIFRKNYTMLAVVFGAGFAFELYASAIRQWAKILDGNELIGF